MERNDAADLLRKPLEQLPDPLPIAPLTGPFEISLRPPGSKSLTNRALLLAALAEGESKLHGALVDAEDAHVMIRALRALGARISIDPQTEMVAVQGRGGTFKGNVALDLQNAGTATRFLAAAACFADGPVVIDGNERMRQRPIGELVAFLRQLGVHVEELGNAGFPPLRISSTRPAGGSMTVGQTLSSQFVSALLMIAPLMREGIEFIFEGEVTSQPYVEMTLNLMRRTVGLSASGSIKQSRIKVQPSAFRPFSYDVEPDASSASYFLAAAAMFPGSSCTIPGLDPDSSLQGDARFIDVLSRLGALVARSDAGITVTGKPHIHPLNIDLSATPDLAMTCASLACLADGESELRGLRTLRVKETDRIAAICTELSRIGAGARVIVGGIDEGLVISPPDSHQLGLAAPPVRFCTYDDHRLAMALALIGLRRPNVTIANPACVAKTYPTFWRDFALLYHRTN